MKEAQIPMRSLKSIIILIFLFSNYLFGTDLNRQDSSKIIGFSTSAGIGGNYFGFTLCGNVSFTINQHLFTVKYSNSKELRFGVENNFDEPSLSLHEFGILYGRYQRKDHLLLSLSVGMSYLNGIKRGQNLRYKEYEQINISTIGFPFELESTFEFTNYMGLGLLFYGNINKEKTFIGGMLRIKMGRFLIK